MALIPIKFIGIRIVGINTVGIKLGCFAYVVHVTQPN